MEDSLNQPVPDTGSEDQNLSEKPNGEISPHKLSAFMEELKAEQNMPMGILAALLGAVLGAVLWALVTVATGFQIGYMAVGVGFLVGYAMRYFGKGIDPVYGYIGGALALFGCLLGNFFTIIGYISSQFGVNVFQALAGLDYGLVPTIMTETFSVIDVLFYGIAVYEGYKFSFRKLTEEELRSRLSA